MRLLIESDWFVTKRGNFVLLEGLLEWFKKVPIHLVHSYLDLLSTRNSRVATLAYSSQRVGWCRLVAGERVRWPTTAPPYAPSQTSHPPRPPCRTASAPPPRRRSASASHPKQLPLPVPGGVGSARGWDSSMSWGEQLEERGGGWG